MSCFFFRLNTPNRSSLRLRRRRLKLYASILLRAQCFFELFLQEALDKERKELEDKHNDKQ